DLIADPRAIRVDSHARSDYADPRGIYENLVPLAAINDFCVAGHKADARSVRSLPHRSQDKREVLSRKSFFDDEGSRKIKRLRAAHREIIDRAMNGEFADIAARKENRFDDVGICAEGEFSAVHGEHGAVVQWFE